MQNETFSLPDRIAALDPSVAKLRTKAWSEHLLSLDSSAFFVRAYLNQAKLWVQIPAHVAFGLLQGTNPGLVYGRVANLIRTDQGPTALFNLAELRFLGEQASILKVIDSWSPYPLLHASASPQPQTEEERLHLRRFELLAATDDHSCTRDYWEKHASLFELSARAQFAAGLFFMKCQEFRTALECFHHAQLLDHPDALNYEFEMHNALARDFRQAYPQIFEQIRRGDRLRTLTVLRQAAAEYPLSANAVLSYCLRNAGVPEDGLAAASASLKLNPNQSDVLSNKWSFLTELGADTEALRTATDHVKLYPTHAPAYRDLIDSLLLLGKNDQALLVSKIYLIYTSVPENALEYIFKVYEQRSEWRELLDEFDSVLENIPNPTASTRCYLGETLIELGEFERALRAFEEALAIEPENANVVLGLARTLARADRELEAEELLDTALRDKTRFDRIDQFAFLVTLLAQIRRRTGRPEFALDTFKSNLGPSPIEISTSVGPLPALEYIEALLDCGSKEEAALQIAELAKLWPNNPHVEELQLIINR